LLWPGALGIFALLSPTSRLSMQILPRGRASRLAAALLLPALLSSPAAAQRAAADVVESRRGMVVCASAPACDAGAAILAQGGNAVDAMVATAFAMAVTYPAAGNIGGGGFMVVQPRRGAPLTFDYREVAPRRSTRTMYLDSTGRIARERTESGYLAPGVPGTVRGLAAAHRRFGRLPWRTVVMPAVRLAEGGFPMSASLAGELNWQLANAMGRFPASVAAYGKAGGGAWQAGDTLRLADLGRTLRAIAERGPDVFYTGWIADSIAADMRRNGGIITRSDLAAYRPRVRPAVIGHAFGHEIVTMGPPSSGATTMLAILHQLERFDAGRRERLAPMTLHLYTEAARRAFLDRARFLGDPDFVKVPVARLTSAAHGRELARTIDTTRASSSVALARGLVTGDAVESDETTHISVVDGEGMAVSNTYTLEGGYGSRVVVRGAGFLLNNEMGDFNKKPGETNARGDIGTAPNLIAPGKRMLSSMSPTIVRKDGRTLLVTGSPGGRTIINTVTEIVLNVTAFGMGVREAVDTPRIHHQWLPDVLMIEPGVPESTAAALRAMGHRVERIGGQGDGHSIILDPATGVARGANDHRSSDSKVSIPGQP
jgi:gamma-glutamyltranspeptidase/glutathione hydrolase